MGWNTVLLTGGTGSFGRHFIEKLLDDQAIGMVRVYSRGEHRQRALRDDLAKRRPGDTPRVSFYIGDVRDAPRLRRAMHGCDWVVHAAALKQAPLGEIEPQEFIKTNVFGSANVAEAAMDLRVEKALLISTDKAVEPINLYGATKMCAEKIFLAMDSMQRQNLSDGAKSTRFACVRYGNVAMTAGSVIPAFIELDDGEPTPICHALATRFWITLEEATRFVLESIKAMDGGEVFIPAMRSVRIMDVAEAIRPGKPITMVGLRPGDKLHETIWSDGMSRRTSDGGDFLSIEEIREHAFQAAGTR